MDGGRNPSRVWASTARRDAGLSPLSHPHGLDVGQEVRGHRSAIQPFALLAYRQQWIPAGVPVLLVGDREFSAVAVIRQREAWEWKSILRQKGSPLIRPPGGEWRPWGEVIQEPSQSGWLREGLRTHKHEDPALLLAYGEKGEKEPWWPATNLTSRQGRLHAYHRRMWVDEMFGDLKSNGFDLESTHLLPFLR